LRAGVAAAVLSAGAVLAAGCTCDVRDSEIVELSQSPPDSCLRASLKHAHGRAASCEPPVIVLRNGCSERLRVDRREILPGTSVEYAVFVAFCLTPPCRFNVLVKLEGNEITLHGSSIGDGSEPDGGNTEDGQ
jgi:hypothetical protein